MLRISRLRVQLPLLFSFLVAAACEQPAEIGLPGGVPFLEQDSAGVLVATTMGARARTPIGWVVDTVPEYQLGAVEGEDPYLFSRISGAQQLSDGRVVVVDAVSCELRFFGQEGDFLELAGGKGEGPGEFNAGLAGRCDLIPSPGIDSLRVFDGARLSLLDDRGRFSRRFPVSWPGQFVTHVAGIAAGRVLAQSRSVTMSQEEGLSSEPSTADFALLELETWSVVWEGFFPGQYSYTVWVNDSPVGRVVSSVPFDIVPDAVLGRDGFFLTLGEDHGPEILEYDIMGRLRRVIRLAESVLVPSPAELDKYVGLYVDRWNIADSSRKTVFDNLRRRYGRMPLPKIMPVFARLLVDEAGWLWAELFRFDVRQPVRWLVFGSNGEGLGSVDMPPDLDVRQIGRDFVLGVWRDVHGVEYVRRHALTGRR